jgi:hypothetical protein
MATIQSVYSLSSQKKVHWSAVQENSLSEFPFELSEESPEEFAYRTYLQFLWLPEVCHDCTVPLLTFYDA